MSFSLGRLSEEIFWTNKSQFSDHILHVSSHPAMVRYFGRRSTMEIFTTDVRAYFRAVGRIDVTKHYPRLSFSPIVKRLTATELTTDPIPFLRYWLRNALREQLSSREFTRPQMDNRQSDLHELKPIKCISRQKHLPIPTSHGSPQPDS